MKRILMIITTALTIASCSNNSSKPLAQNKIDSVYGVAKYVNDFNRNSFGEGAAILYLVDTLKPDPTNPEKNVLQKDSFFVVAMPAVLVDSATRKPVISSRGTDSIVLVKNLIPKEAIYDFKPVRTRKNK